MSILASYELSCSLDRITMKHITRTDIISSTKKEVRLTTDMVTWLMQKEKKKKNRMGNREWVQITCCAA